MKKGNILLFMLVLGSFLNASGHRSRRRATGEDLVKRVLDRAAKGHFTDCEGCKLNKPHARGFVGSLLGRLRKMAGLSTSQRSRSRSEDASELAKEILDHAAGCCKHKHGKKKKSAEL